jgi:hypothetical protein
MDRLVGESGLIIELLALAKRGLANEADSNDS